MHAFRLFRRAIRFAASNFVHALPADDRERPASCLADRIPDIDSLERIQVDIARLQIITSAIIAGDKYGTGTRKVDRHFRTIQTGQPQMTFPIMEHAWAERHSHFLHGRSQYAVQTLLQMVEGGLVRH